mmetsp:Transcript_118871/g.371686  ORF Transcript_118871/g.371686 Transcript_118871/m.371686 type:complete len:201 (-) Transcript_118871:15-617(-)
MASARSSELLRRHAHAGILDRPAVHIARQRLAHVVGVLVARIVAHHCSVDDVSQALVEGDGLAVRGPHEEVHEVALMHPVARLLQKLHEPVGHARAPELGRHGDGGDVAVPLLVAALDLADDVAGHGAVCGFRHGTALGPAREVVEVERHVEGLRPAVEVHVVEVHQVLGQHGPEGRHGGRARPRGRALAPAPRAAAARP